MTKICQSCAMPMDNEAVYATGADGAKNDEYCMYCMQDGAFTAPDATMEGMVEICVPFMTESGMKEDEARAIMKATLPQLKRWKA